jgi:hypothetical protein
MDGLKDPKIPSVVAGRCVKVHKHAIQCLVGMARLSLQFVNGAEIMGESIEAWRLIRDAVRTHRMRIRRVE